MSGYTQSKHEIFNRAFLEALRFFDGNLVKLSGAIHYERSATSKWKNNTGMKIPYDRLLVLADLTGVSIDRLAPFEGTKDANSLVRRPLAEKPFLPTQTFINSDFR